MEEKPEPKPKRGRAPGPYSNDPNISSTLKKMRITRGLRQKDVVENTDGNLSLNSYNKYEKGVMYPSEAKLNVILDAMNTDKKEWTETYGLVSKQVTPDLTADTRMTQSVWDHIQELTQIYLNASHAEQITILGTARQYKKDD